MCHDQRRVPLADLYPRRIPDGTVIWTAPSGNEQDTGLADSLQAEAEADAVLAWSLTGWIEY